MARAKPKGSPRAAKDTVKHSQLARAPGLSRQAGHVGAHAGVRPEPRDEGGLAAEGICDVAAILDVPTFSQDAKDKITISKLV